MATDTTPGERGTPLRVGMVGLGMIFDETYLPALTRLDSSAPAATEQPVSRVRLVGVATRTGTRAERFRATAPPSLREFESFAGPQAVADLLALPLDLVCVATPDDRHFDAAFAALAAGKHVLVEKPSVLHLGELDRLVAVAAARGVLCKVVYHKLLDPDHKKLRTHVLDGVLSHVNNGYCSLLEPKAVSRGQFAEWVGGRNPSSYVGIHYVKLIDFTFGPAWGLRRVSATGQRGQVGPPDGPTWDSVQLRVEYAYPDGREAAFDIHTSWVTPDNSPGYVEQEVQFRFDNGVWNAHQRKRGVEMTVENRTPGELKETPNHHYNAAAVEPWGARTRRGYGIEAVRRAFDEVWYVEFGGPAADRPARLAAMRALAYNDLSADRNCVAVVQATEAILAAHAAGRPGGVVEVNGPAGGLALYLPGEAAPRILYPGRV